MSQDRAAFAGELADLPVADLLQTIVDGRHSGLVRFDTELGGATVWFRDGQLIDADMGRFHMEAAIRRLMPLTSGAFEVEFKPIDRKRVIETDSVALLDEAHSRAPGRGPAGRARGRAAASWHPTGGGAAKRDAPTSSDDRQGPRGTMFMHAAPGRNNPEPAASRAPQAPERGRTDSLLAKPKVSPPPETKRPAETSGRDPVAAPPDVSARAPIAAPPTVGSTSRLSEAGMRDAVNRIAAVRRAAHPEPPLESAHGDALPEGMTMDEAPRLPPTPKGFEQMTTRRMVDDDDDAPDPDESARTRIVMRPEPKDTDLTVPAPSRSAAPPSSGMADDNEQTRIAPGAPKPLHDSPSSRLRRAAAKPSVPFEPERLDRTLMRPGPVPPPKQAPLAKPKVTVAEDAKTMAPPGAPLPEPGAPRFGAPIIDLQELPVESYPIHIDPPTPGGTTPGAPILDPGFGLNDVRVLGQGGTIEAPAIADEPAQTGHTMFSAKPLLRDPNAAATMRLTDEEAQHLKEHAAAVRAAQAQQAKAPATVGRYEVLLRLARGGMGTVYLARVTGEGGFRRLFALKVIRDHLSANPEYVRMLLREARIASRLHHPNVVSIVDIGTLANQHYLVMDYVEGCTFSELLKFHKHSRPPQLIVPIVLDALTGLHAAHSLTDDDGTPLTLVHCDFSPQNMLVGANGTCRITDFGISKARDAAGDSRVARGKPAYLSPEQATGGLIDHRSDVFSAGVVLWNALTGEQLFAAPTPEETLHNVISKPIPVPSTVGLRPPACFDPVVMRVLERDPSRRYQTAEAMLMDLRRVAISHDLLAAASDVARWVADTFGRQIELRRQAAGLAPRAPVTLGRDVSPIPPDRALVPTGGHGQGFSDGSDTVADSASASKTALIPTQRRTAGAAPAGAARTVVFVVSALMAATFIALLVINPQLLEGGMFDENGVYGKYEPPPPVREPTDPDKADADDGKADADDGKDDGGGKAAANDGKTPDDGTPADEGPADEAGDDGGPADEAGDDGGAEAGADDGEPPEPDPEPAPTKKKKKAADPPPTKKKKKKATDDAPKDPEPKKDPKKDPPKDPPTDPEPKKDPPKQDPPPVEPPPDLDNLFKPLGQ